MLEAISIQVYYHTGEALRGISLRVEDGTVATIIGANGAGKSTTLRAISGLIKISSGEIWFHGKRIDGVSTQAIVTEGIAHVPEGRRIFPDMTVEENLRMGAYTQRGRGGVNASFDIVHKYFPVLNVRRKQRAGSLSGGEQQMLAIGRALMSKPKLLLMDEPTIGLAPLMVEEVAKIINEIHQKGAVSILLVEQNAHMALSLAERGYVMETGRIVLEGSASDLCENEQVKKAYLGG
jgi:branched-chain amino acid transport system ATP-binding protein